jgi:hypothetical protein
MGNPTPSPQHFITETEKPDTMHNSSNNVHNQLAPPALSFTPTHAPTKKHKIQDTVSHQNQKKM